MNADPSPLLAVTPRRLWVLDGMRAPAALLIVGFHALGTVTGNHAEGDSSMFWIGWLSHGGAFGVNSFFFLSGFGTHLAILRRSAQSVHWTKFFVRRFWRIYPLYLLAIVLGITLNFVWALARHRDAVGHLPSVVDVASHLLLLHTLRPDTFFGIVPALWFVGVIAQFYILYPVFVVWSGRWGETKALISIAAMTLAVRWSCSRLGHNVSPDSRWYEVLWMNAPTRWFEWVFGAWVARKFLSGQTFPAWAGTLCLVLSIAWTEWFVHWQVVYDPVLTVLLGMFLWALATHVHRSPPNWARAPLFLGQISYAIYLLHQIFLPFVASEIAGVHPPAALFCLIVFVITCVIAVPTAYLVHRYYEAPLAARG